MNKQTDNKPKPTTNKEITCKRCNVSCQSDLCANCAMTRFIMGLPMAAPINKDPEKLQVPQLQKNLVSLMQASNPDIQSSQINWSTVITNWNLPFPSKEEEQSNE